MSVVPKRGVQVARDHAPTDPLEIVREYAAIQQMEKDLEARKKALKPKLNMLIPADLDAKAFEVPEINGRYVARRIKQDRRKPDDDLLVRLLKTKYAPDEAYDRKPNHEYVAQMIERGEITLEEFAATMKGAEIEFVSLTLEKAKV